MLSPQHPLARIILQMPHGNIIWKCFSLEKYCQRKCGGGESVEVKEVWGGGGTKCAGGSRKAKCPGFLR